MEDSTTTTGAAVATPAVRWIRAALFALTASVFVFTAPPAAHWLDSGELAAAAATLGIPHAPGHPSYVIAGHGVSLLPVGSLGFRISLFSALCAALCVVLVFELGRLLAAATSSGDGDPPLAVPAAALAALGFGLSGALWLQAARPEVYSFHLLIALAATWAAVRFHVDAAPRPARGPMFVALLLALGLTNHHLLMVSLAPALLLLLLASADQRRACRRALGPALLLGLSAGLLYALLPLRALHDPVIDYGDPRTFGRFWDMVTAATFQRSVTAASTPLLDNLGAAFGMFVDALGGVVLLFGVGGLGWIVARRRALGLALVVAMALNLATKVLMDLDPSNPDAMGYFLTGMALLSVASVAGISALASLSGPLWRPVAAAGLALILLTAGLRTAADLPRVDLSDHRTPALVDAIVAGRAPPNALVMPQHYSLYFNRAYHEAVAGMRPDVANVHQGMYANIDGGRAHAALLTRRFPDLAPLFEAFLATGRFPRSEVLALSSRRPVLLEPHTSRPVPADHERYEGYLRVFPGRAGPSRVGLEAQAADQEALVRLGGDELTRSPEARKTLIIVWLQLAVVRLSQGSGRGAAMALQLVEHLAPGNPYGARLRPLVEPMEQAERGGDVARLERMKAAVERMDFSSLFAAQ